MIAMARLAIERTSEFSTSVARAKPLTDPMGSIGSAAQVARAVAPLVDNPILREEAMKGWERK